MTMDAVMYLKEKARMTKVTEECMHCGLMCNDCPLSSTNNEDGIECSNFEMLHPEDAVAAVEKWGKEHPQKTYKDDLLEKIPNASLFENGTPKSCAKFLGYCKECPSVSNCGECWNTPMEE